MLRDRIDSWLGRRPSRGVLYAAGFGLAALGPSLLSEFWIGLLPRFIVLAILAISLDLLWGHTGLLSFALGAAIAGFAGALIAPVFVASPDMGVRWIVPAFLVVIVGGMGSIYAAVVGGIAIATLQASSEYFYSLSVAQVIVFAAAILVVRFRPRGLIGAA